jgi:hypothetical protein
MANFFVLCRFLLRLARSARACAALPFRCIPIGIFAIAVTFACFSGTRVSATDAPVVTFNGQGLAGLEHGGFNFLTTGHLEMSLRTILPNGTRDYLNNNNTGSAWDLATRTLTKTYLWGNIRVTYTPMADRLQLNVEIENQTASPIVDLNLHLLQVRFPQTPAGIAFANGFEQSGLGVDSVTAIPADYVTGYTLICNDRVGEPVRFGIGPYGQGNWVIRMSLTTNNLPQDPQIPAGATARYQYSIRFGEPTTPLRSLAGDLYEAFAQRFPFNLYWPDRRAIAKMFISNAFLGSAVNPRGWLNEPDLDVTAPGGQEAFRVGMMQQADRSIAIMREMNAQGVIVWDIESEEFPWLTYVGDPRMLPQLAPEMDLIADEYMGRFSSAGFKVGVCIRPSRIVPGFVGSGHLWDHDNYGFDVLEELDSKVKYARQRWGCTMFYMDTNIRWDHDNNGNFVPRRLEGSVVRELQRRNPECLIACELPDQVYWSAGAPYQEVRSVGPSTPRDVLECYPNAFTVLEPKDMDLTPVWDQLVVSVRRGDLLLFTGWFPDPANERIKAIYNEAHPKPVIRNARTAETPKEAPFSLPVLIENEATQVEVGTLPTGLSFDRLTRTIVGTPTEPGVYEVHIAARSLWGEARATVQLAVTNTLLRWLKQRFGVYETLGSFTAKSDAESDGVPNDLEFAFGGNPLERDSKTILPILAADAASGCATVTFRRLKDPAIAPQYIVEESTDLEEWAPVTLTTNIVGTPIDNGDGTESVTVRGNCTALDGGGFLRVRVVF